MQGGNIELEETERASMRSLLNTGQFSHETIIGFLGAKPNTLKGNAILKEIALLTEPSRSFPSHKKQLTAKLT